MKDIPLYKPHIPARAGSAVAEVLESGQIAGDGNLPAFEEKLRQFLGAAHLVVTAEFSRSLEMALRMADVGPGDSVLTASLACLATTMPILQTGARPVWCDIDPTTGNLDPDEVLRRRLPNTKAVLLYHWVGFPADVQSVLRIATDSGLKVIEDAGEALGAELDGKRIGTHGCDYSVFSFSPVRHITTGEGAAIICRDAGQAEMARRLRRYGIPPTGFRDSLGELSSACDIKVPGFHNYMNRVAGTLGALQMECLPGIVEAHRRNGAYFDENLAGIPGIRLLARTPKSVPSYWVYSFLCERRDDLLRKLRQSRIYASKVHMRNDSYSCFGTGPVELEGVARFEREQLSIPCGWWLSDEDREYILETFRSGW
jgi:dTDP-4-amino-4,6-dideoxygalactose transaminase